MEALEQDILAKRAELKEVLSYALSKNPVSFRVVKDLKLEIYIYDLALMEIRLNKNKALLG